jgi:hypothetical protein
MKLIPYKSILFGAALLALLGCFMVAAPVTTLAASPEATQYCKSYGGAHAACEAGYDGGKANKSQDQSCNPSIYDSDGLSACINAWGYAAKVDPATNCNDKQCDVIGKYVGPAITLLAISFGLIATISLILGGIQYSMSEGDPQKSSSAKNRITNTIIAVVAFLFLFAFLEFLIPGGVFNRHL